MTEGEGRLDVIERIVAAAERDLRRAEEAERWSWREVKGTETWQKAWQEYVNAVDKFVDLLSWLEESL